MSDSRTFRLRVWYVKHGRLCMLSHLEVARALERAVRRAQLPFAVSQGFSPHMRIAFGAALPVGVGGEAEFFDVFLREYIPAERALIALQKASAGNLMPYQAAYVEPQATAASVAFPVSTYAAVMDGDVSGLVIPDEVEVVRKKKRKTLQIGDFLVGDVQAEGNTLTFTLVAHPTGSLRPDVFLDACIAETLRVTPGEQLSVVSITRTAQKSLEEGLYRAR